MIPDDVRSNLDAAADALTKNTIDSTIDVVTPENISFEYQVAGPFRRLPAFLIDLVVRVAIWAMLLILLIFLGSTFGGVTESFGAAIWIVAWFVLEWFYGGILETYWNGQTVGKRVLQMRVLRTDGQPLNGLQAIMRNILRMVDMMPLLPLGLGTDTEGAWVFPTCLIGLLTPIMNSRYQRLGDLVCGTMVVVERRRHLVNTTKLMQQPELQRLAAQLPSSFVTSPKLSNALGTYIERRRYLSRARRVEIARNLGPLLTARLGLPADLDHDLLLCALYNRVFVGGPQDIDL